MFSTPLICSSIGATTVEATTSAFAPGYWPDTLMTGGAISGYCAIGRRDERDRAQDHDHDRDDRREDRTVDEEVRYPHVGRLLGLGLRTGRRRVRALLLRRDLLARPHAHQAVDDDTVVGVQPVLDDAQLVVGQRAQA